MRTVDPWVTRFDASTLLWETASISGNLSLSQAFAEKFHSARLVAKAGDGILCDADTCTLVSSGRRESHGIQFAHQGTIKVKGKAVPV